MKHKGRFCILLGLLLIAAAAALVLHNLAEEHRALVASAQAEAVLERHIQAVRPPSAVTPEAPVTDLPEPLPIPSEPVEIPDYQLNPEMEMPAVEHEENSYIGILSLPTLGLDLPIIGTWDYAALQTAPCRYSGSAYQNDLVLMGHNYTPHFRALPDLREGDLVRFTDMDGNVFSYTVMARETLQPTEIEQMTTGDWDLTLFTCTIGGAYRFAVRCKLA